MRPGARAALTVAVAALVGCWLPSCSPQGGEVEMEGTAFRPARLVVPAGTTVTWTNASDLQHTVTAYDGSLPAAARYFASGGAGGEEAARADLAAGLIGPGGTFSVTLTEPGTYRYFCIPHEDRGMVGTIVVERR